MILLAVEERKEGKTNGGVGEKGENNRTAAQDVVAWQVKLGASHLCKNIR
jgi:hypothetical protein